ncbi:MAG: hypothetical protein IGS48_13825 [Oscillatoriales cyanobacterium C42_A2020_001]|nr:hypothetical protein [Leptolyngbyaceae cyanobacterium C42_A2020_001]
MKIYPLLSASLVVLSSAIAIAPPTQPGIAQLNNANPNVFFRTQHYGVQIVWRGRRPYMTVSNNGWRVMVDAPAKILPPRGVADSWTTYTAASGDYLAVVRVGSGGEGAIAVALAGKRITEEYAKPTSRKKTSTAKIPEQNGTVLEFQTEDYAVRVYRQQGELWMNLYNRKTEKIDLKQAAVTLTSISDATVYRHDGKATVQAREDVRGMRSLFIIQDNQVLYRGEGY